MVLLRKLTNNNKTKNKNNFNLYEIKQCNYTYNDTNCDPNHDVYSDNINSNIIHNNYKSNGILIIIMINHDVEISIYDIHECK